MDELISQVTQKTGLSPDDARKAVEVVISALKRKLPTPVAAHLDTLLAGGLSGEMDAIKAEAGEILKGEIGKFLGGAS